MFGGDSVKDGPLKLDSKLKDSECSLLAHKYPNESGNKDTCLSQDVIEELGGIDKIKKKLDAIMTSVY